MSGHWHTPLISPSFSPEILTQYSSLGNMTFSYKGSWTWGGYWQRLNPQIPPRRGPLSKNTTRAQVMSFPLSKWVWFKVLPKQTGAPYFPVIFHQLGCFQSLGKERKRRNLRLEHRISPTGEQTVSSPCVVSTYRQRPRWGCDCCQHVTCRRGDRTGSAWLSCPARVSWFPLLASGPSSGKLHSSVTPLAEAGSLKDTCYYPAFTGDRSRGLCDSPEYYYGTPFTP